MRRGSRELTIRRSGERCASATAKTPIRMAFGLQMSFLRPLLGLHAIPRSQSPVRDGIEAAKIHAARRRLYRRFFEPVVLATIDADDRKHDAQLFWEATAPLAEHLVANMMGSRGDG
jgi:hypothetical protein